METLIVLAILNSIYGCPCAYRTCGIKHYAPGEVLEWEANNLDCDYVKGYLDKESGYILKDEAKEAWDSEYNINITIKNLTNGNY